MISKSLSSKVLSSIKATSKEHKAFEKEVFSFIDILKKSANELGLNVDFKVGGSFGKGTYLKNSFDVDLFCLFEKSYGDTKISKLLKKILIHSKLSFDVQKGSRDYYSGIFGKNLKTKFKFEVIPVLNIKNLNDAKNSTDLSPFHIDYIHKKAEKNKNLRDEIRLAKQFFKSKKLYGAESYILGFSGHIIDCLIAYYGSLESLLLEAKTWIESTILDPNHFYKNEKEIETILDSSKKSSLILIDPIVKERNAARALSFENYCKFIYFCKNIETLHEIDFKIKKETAQTFLSELKKKSKKVGTDILVYNFTLDDLSSEDIAGSKLKKLCSKISTHYASFDFMPLKSYFYISFSENICVYVLEFVSKTFPKEKLITGPSIFMDEAVKGFLQNRKSPFILKDRVCVYEKRKYISLEKIPNLLVDDCKKIFGKNIDFILKIEVEKILNS